MQTTLAAISLIRDFEGFRPEAYLDPKGIWTIGSGLTRWSDGKPVGPGDEISEERDEEEMFHHIRKEVEPALDRHFGQTNLMPSQRDALASFVYNLGPDADGAYPTLKRLIVDGAPLSDVARQWVKYRNKGSSFELGLYRRRVAEVLMWAGLPWEGAKDIQLSDSVQEMLDKALDAQNLFEEEEPALPPPPEPVEEIALPEPVIGTAPPSPNTRTPNDVPYKVDTEAGSKPMEESKRFWGTMLEAVGHFMRTWSARVAGGAGVTVGFFGDVLKNPAVILIVAAAISWLVFFLVTHHGRKLKKQGETEATQLLH